MLKEALRPLWCFAALKGRSPSAEARRRLHDSRQSAVSAYEPEKLSREKTAARSRRRTSSARSKCSRIGVLDNRGLRQQLIAKALGKGQGPSAALLGEGSDA